jgi:catecholate siderophore receptor
MKQDSGVPGRHEVKNDRWGIAPSLAFGLNSPTRVFLNYVHIDQDNVPDGGVPTIGLPGYTSPDSRSYLPRRRGSFGLLRLVGDYDKVTSDMFTARVEHDFSPDVKLQNTTRYAKTSQDYLLTSFMASAANLVTPSASNPSGWTISRTLPPARTRATRSSPTRPISPPTCRPAASSTPWSAASSSPGEAAPSPSPRSGTFPAANLYNPNPNDPTYTMTATGYNDGKTDTVSAYLFDTVKFNEQWSLNGGIREDHYRTTYYSNAGHHHQPVDLGQPVQLEAGGDLQAHQLQQHLRLVRYLAAAAGRRQLRAERVGQQRRQRQLRAAEDQDLGAGHQVGPARQETGCHRRSVPHRSQQ